MSCPGEGQHTTRTTATDCKVVCAPVEKPGGLLKPGVYCFHDSCRGAVEAASFLLRSSLGKRSPGQPWQYFSPRPAPKPKPPNSILPSSRRSRLDLDGVDAAWLAARSPIRPDNRTPASFLHALYRPGEKILIFDVFESQGQGVWTYEGRPLTPASLTASASESVRSLVLDQPRRWRVSTPTITATSHGAQRQTSPPGDTSWSRAIMLSPADWLAALAQMPLPIAAIYTSGGRSIHALVRVDAESKAHWDGIAASLKPALISPWRGSKGDVGGEALATAMLRAAWEQQISMESITHIPPRACNACFISTRPRIRAPSATRRNSRYECV